MKNNPLPSALPGFETFVKPFKFRPQPYEYKVQALRECPTPEELHLCDRPAKAADYWRLHVPTHPYFNPDCECFVVLMLNIKLRIKGHYLVSVGTMDTTVVHCRDVFRVAIMASAYSIILTHNHPSGDPTPSLVDIKMTRRLVRAGRLLDVPVLGHLVMGSPDFSYLGGRDCFET